MLYYSFMIDTCHMSRPWNNCTNVVWSFCHIPRIVSNRVSHPAYNKYDCDQFWKKFTEIRSFILRFLYIMYTFICSIWKILSQVHQHDQCSLKLF